MQIISLFLYTKLVKAKTTSISVFVYLCSLQIIPNALFVLIFTLLSKTFFLFYIGLHIMFFFLTILPISEFKDTKQTTDTKLFVILPVMTYVFNLAMSIRVLFMFAYDDTVLREFIKVDADSVFTGKKGEHFGRMPESVSKFISNDLTAMLLPGVFVIAVLIIAFYVIARNIKYINRAEKAHNETKALSVEVMEALAHTIDAKDEYTRGHSVRVAKYSRMIALKMGLSEEQCENIYYMGLLHDIGKIGVPNEIINKPDRLTDEEYDVIKTHPRTGYEILAEIKSRPNLSVGARWHHERFDGKGYPDKKAGDEIPLEARIIAVADCYDAMTSNRSYRSYMSQAKVRLEIEKGIGTQFDEVPARCMLAIIDEDKDYNLHEA